MGAGDDVGVALAGELTHDGGAYHAAVSGYVYFGFFVHIIQLCAFGGLRHDVRLCAVGGCIVYDNIVDLKADNCLPIAHTCP